MTSPAKTSAALGWAESAERVADPVARAQAKTLAWVATRITRQTGLPVVTGPALDALSVDALYDHKETLGRERDEVEARIHDVDEAICRAQGDREAETWHRLRARAYRTRDPKDDARARTAWADMMAAYFLRSGKRPDPSEHGAAEIEAAMARIAP
jgi:hypothetical protein